MNLPASSVGGWPPHLRYHGGVVISLSQPYTIEIKTNRNQHTVYIWLVLRSHDSNKLYNQAICITSTESSMNTESTISGQHDATTGVTTCAFDLACEYSPSHPAYCQILFSAADPMQKRS